MKLFSITPTSVNDERTASVLGLFNSTRRSRMSAETLIRFVQTREFYLLGAKSYSTDLDLLQHPRIKREEHVHDIHDENFPLKITSLIQNPEAIDDNLTEDIDDWFLPGPALTAISTGISLVLLINHLLGATSNATPGTTLDPSPENQLPDFDCEKVVQLSFVKWELELR